MGTNLVGKGTLSGRNLVGKEILSGKNLVGKETLLGTDLGRKIQRGRGRARIDPIPRLFGFGAECSVGQSESIAAYTLYFG